MSETVIVKGYKVFNSDWTCAPNGNVKQYTCPGKFEEDIMLVRCGQGMHFCKKAVDCFGYYEFNPKHKVAEVVAYGDVVEEGDKCCTNKLEIIREVPWNELLELVNTGKGCTGNCNSGNRNSGDYNSGNYNSGDYNSGNRNSGDYNSGNYNIGDYNSGNYNIGDCNSGNCNSGDCNSGNCNSGDYNKTNYASGCFNTVETKIYLFNKPSEWTYRDWIESEARCILRKMPADTLVFVHTEDMTNEEKAANPEHEVTGGYLKKIDNSECRNEWWHSLSENQKSSITEIPNFDKKIFKEITGIEVENE